MPTTFRNGIISKNGVNQGVSVPPSSTASQERNSVNPRQSVSNFLGSAVNFGEKVGGNFGKALVEETINATGFGRFLRGGNLPLFGMPDGGGFLEGSWGSQAAEDWRLRLSIPSNFNIPGPLGSKLAATNGLVFPYTPTVLINHSANYGQMSPTHSNYPFPIYRNSEVNVMSITGDFSVENEDEAIYWIAAIHYLRSVTKMAYGNTSNKGSPPPVVRMNGYGDFVFKNVPVVVNQFSVDLPNDVDYLHVRGIGPSGTWVPVRSVINVTVTPTYSRRAVQAFSLDKFVSGGYANGNGVGFI